MFTRMSISWNVNQLSKMYGNGKLNLDAIIQRSFKWEISRQSLLIHSTMAGYPIPPLYTEKRNGVYYVYDGKQRIIAVYKYVNDEYALVDVPTVTLEDGTEYDPNGKKFSELPEELRDAIKNYPLTVYYFDGITEEEVRSMFKRLNNGKPLTAKERAIANCTDIETLLEISKHEFFTVACTEKAITDRKPVALLAKAYMMLHMDINEVSFGAKDVNDAMENMSVTEDEKAELTEILDYAKAIYDICIEIKKTIARRFVTETHFISLIPFLKRGLDEHKAPKKMARFICSLFEDKVIISDEYAALCQSGSNKNASIMARNDIINGEYNYFFDADTESDVDDGEADDSMEEIARELAETFNVADDDDAVADNDAETETTDADADADATESVKTVTEDSLKEGLKALTEGNTATYRYGMRNRGCAPGCQPKDFTSFEDDPDGMYHNILVYSRELTEEELKEYELDKLD